MLECWRALALVLLAGLGIRLVLAFVSVGEAFDIESLEIVARRLRHDPLHIYETGRWPYPPLYSPWALAARGINRWTGLPFHGVVQIPPMLADMALAIVVAWWLQRRGLPARVQLFGAALVALGPAFILISGYQGQFDSLAILPAVAACLVWQERVAHRDVKSGLLIGVGIALKTFPGLALVALLPTARSLREAGRVVLFAAIVPLATLLPYLIEAPSAVRSALRYAGLPGAGGPSLIFQPDLADSWLLATAYNPSSLTDLMSKWNIVPVGLAMLLALAVLRWWRTPPVDAAVLIWLVVLVVSWNFFFQYAVWGLPFYLLAGKLRPSAWFQIAVTVPGIVFFMRPWTTPWLADVYKVAMIALWVGVAVACVLWARGLHMRARSDKVRGRSPVATEPGSRTVTPQSR